MENIKLFTYGSLMDGEAKSSLIPEELVSKRQLAAMWGEGIWLAAGGDYPIAIVHDKQKIRNSFKIMGEVITFKDSPKLVSGVFDSIEQSIPAIKTKVFFRDAGFAFPVNGSAGITCIFYNTSEIYRKVTSHYPKIKDGDFRQLSRRMNNYDSAHWGPRAV